MPDSAFHILHERGNTLLVLTFAPGAIAGGVSTQRSKEI
jgi:hypothetical protein